MTDFQAENPFALFAEWLEEAKSKEINDPTAMALATVDGQGLPDVRMVLLKAHGPDGFVFYTNFESAKARELHQQPKAGLLFHWKSLRRQVRVRGVVTTVTAQEANAYFESRPRDSQIGAWASDQSRPLDARETLERRVADVAAKFHGEPVPRPPHWSGFRIVPDEIEFWKDGAYRLHDRLLCRRDSVGAAWRSQRLYP